MTVSISDVALTWDWSDPSQEGAQPSTGVRVRPIAGRKDVCAINVLEDSDGMPDCAEVLRVDVGAELDLPTFPLIVLVLDELAELLAGGITRGERARDGRVASLLPLLVDNGLAAGIVPVLATQEPVSDAIPTATAIWSVSGWPSQPRRPR